MLVWIPRVDDEVLVSFENGDINHPVIISSAYNSVKMPAFDVANQFATTAIKPGFIATAIHLNPSSSGSATPSQLQTQILNPDTTKTKTYGAIQNDVLASDGDLADGNQTNSQNTSSKNTTNLNRSDETSAPPVSLCHTYPTKAPNNLMGTCDYYTWRNQDFIKRHQGCDHLQPPDYYLDYGYKYCQRFSTELYPKLSDQGKAWLVKARLYLQEAIEDLLQKNPDIELDNDQFNHRVFQTHPGSYMRGGFSELTKMDYVNIFLHLNYQHC